MTAILLHPVLPYSGKLLQVQTFANLLSEAPEEIFTVSYFCDKPWLAQYQAGC